MLYTAEGGNVHTHSLASERVMKKIAKFQFRFSIKNYSIQDYSMCNIPVDTHNGGYQVYN